VQMMYCGVMCLPRARGKILRVLLSAELQATWSYANSHA